MDPATQVHIFIISKNSLSFINFISDSSYRVCALPGATPGATFLSGEEYIDRVYNIKVSEKALNIIVVILFWLLFTVINYFLVEKIDRVSGTFILH